VEKFNYIITLIKEKIQLTTWELSFVALSGLGLACMLFLGVLVLKSSYKVSSSYLKEDMEVLAYQIGHAYLSLERRKQSRQLATTLSTVPQEGRIGKDIWGSPFAYRIKENKVFVLSLGPNRKKDTKSFETQARQDDFLVSYSLDFLEKTRP